MSKKSREKVLNHDEQLIKVCDEILYYYQEICSISGTISCAHVYSGHAYEILYMFPVSSNFVCDVESVINSTLSDNEIELLKNSKTKIKKRNIKIKLAFAFQKASIYPIKNYVSNFV